jgi:hypothetical protein
VGSGRKMRCQRARKRDGASRVQGKSELPRWGPAKHQKFTRESFGSGSIRRGREITWRISGRIESSLPVKNIPLSENRKTCFKSRRAALTRGASPSSRTWSAGCDGRFGAAGECAQGGRSSRVVLSPRRWGQARGRFRERWRLSSPVLQGERGVSRNTIVQGMPE